MSPPKCRWCGRFLSSAEARWIEENVSCMPEYPYELDWFAKDVASAIIGGLLLTAIIALLCSASEMEDHLS